MAYGFAIFIEKVSLCRQCMHYKIMNYANIGSGRRLDCKCVENTVEKRVANLNAMLYTDCCVIEVDFNPKKIDHDQSKFLSNEIQYTIGFETKAGLNHFKLKNPKLENVQYLIQEK